MRYHPAALIKSNGLRVMIPLEKHIEDITNLIPKHPIFTFKDIFVYYKGCTRQWAYTLGIDKNDTIKELIYDNKRKGVSSMLATWVKSSNPTLSIAAMRILSDDDERKKLAMQYNENNNTHKVEGFDITKLYKGDKEA